MTKSVISSITNHKTLTMADVQLTAYNVKTKEKGVPILDAVITKTAKGAYMAQGHDGKGNKLTTLLNGERTLTANNASIATRGWKSTDCTSSNIINRDTSGGVLIIIGRC